VQQNPISKVKRSLKNNRGEKLGQIRTIKSVDENCCFADAATTFFLLSLTNESPLKKILLGIATKTISLRTRMDKK